MINSGQYLDNIIQNLTVLRQEITSKAQLGFTDLNKHCEDFLKEILNITYDLKLKNLNEKSATFPGLDLGDEHNTVAYQITSTKTSEKVDHTLELCKTHKHYLKFKNINVFILTSKQTSYTIKTITTPDFEFNVKENILDFDDLYKDILVLDVDKRKKLCEYIQKELPYYWNLIRALDSYQGPETVPVTTKNPDEEIKRPIPLIETAINIALSNMTAYVLWVIEIEISSFPNLTTPNLYKGLQRNQLLRNGQVIPFILNPIYRKTADPNRVRYIQPLHSTGPINHLVEQQLLVQENVMTFEFSEYHDHDFSLADLNTPISSLVFFLLILQKYHEERGTIPVINILVQIESTKPALIHSDSSPFDFGSIFENYALYNNNFELKEKLVLFDDDSIYALIQNIYHAFVCSSQRVQSPYLTINKDDFRSKMTELKQEFKLK